MPSYHFQVTIEITPTGNPQAKFVQLDAPFVGVSVSYLDLTLHQLLPAVNGWRAATNHVQLLEVFLYWIQGYPSEKNFHAIEHYFRKHIYSTVLGNETYRRKILASLPSSDWYCDGHLIK
jgi:hypothetical protein